MRFPGLKLTARVGGLAKVVSQLRAKDETLQANVRAEVKRAGQGIRELTQFIAPKDTGYMASVVREDYFDDGLAVEVGWHEEDFLSVGLPEYYVFQEYGTSKMPAQPSLGPAYDIIRPEFEKRMRAMLQQEVARGAA